MRGMGESAIIVELKKANFVRYGENCSTEAIGEVESWRSITKTVAREMMWETVFLPVPSAIWLRVTNLLTKN